MKPESKIEEALPMDAWSVHKLRPELFPEERLLWCGRPQQGLLFQQSDAWSLVFGTLFGGIVLALILLGFNCIPMPDQWKEGSSTLETRVGCILWSIILLPLSLYWLGGNRLLDDHSRRHVYYGVTNERILILRETRKGAQMLNSLRLGDVPHLHLAVDIHGVGSLSFGPRVVGSGGSPHPFGISFRLIPEVRKVYSLIRSIQRETSNTRSPAPPVEMA